MTIKINAKFDQFVKFAQEQVIAGNKKALRAMAAKYLRAARP